MNEMDIADERTRPPEGPGPPRPTPSASVGEFLAELRAAGTGPVPTPSAELAAMLEGAAPVARRRLGAALVSRPVVRRVALVAAALVVGSTAAAANHSLPAPAQRVVSDVVNNLTPFHIDPAPRMPTVPPAPTTPRPAPTSNEPSVDGGESSPGADDGSGSPGGGDDGRRGGTGSSGTGDGNGARQKDDPGSTGSTGSTGERTSSSGRPQDDDSGVTGPTPSRTRAIPGDDAPGDSAAPGLRSGEGD